MTDENESWVYVATDKGVYPYSVLKAAEQKPESKQLTKKVFQQEGLVPHPFEVSTFLKLKDNCPYFDACAEQIALDTVGQGWNIILEEGKKENNQELDRINYFLENSGGDREETFKQSLQRGILDWGVIGWIGWEVSRGENKLINGFWHVPSQTFYIHKSFKKYCQKRNTSSEWFKQFGLEYDINSKTGKREKAGGENKANELIYYKNYYEQSDYYGAPNILSATGSVIGFIGVRDYNLAFFENYGIPAALIKLSGKWSKTSAKQISDFIDVEIKRTENAHKTMVVHPGKDCTLEWVPIVTTETKEGSFKIMKKDLRDEILVPYRMPPYRIGIAEVGRLGGSTSPESNLIYYHGVIQPLEDDINTIVTNKVFRKGLQVESYRFKLNSMDIRNLARDVEIYVKLFTMAAMTPNQIIKETGYGKEYPEGDKYFVASTFIEAGEVEPGDLTKFRQHLVEKNLLKGNASKESVKEIMKIFKGEKQ